MGDADLSVDYCRDERIMIKQPTNNEYPEKDDEDDEQEEEDESHADESTLCSTVVAEDRKARPHYYPSTIPEDRADDGTLGESTIASAQVENRYNEEEDDEEGDDGDDVTTLCPTVIANQPIPEDAAVLEDYRARNEAHHDISQVEVENDTSYSRTFLTMDGTMMNLNDLEVMSQQSSRYVNDAASLGEETPVLDRYRIDLDDNSIGFKVVPNERGSSRRKAKQNTLFKENDFTMDSPFTIPKAVQFPDRISMDAEPRHVYRKTPHPKESRLAADNAEREFTTEAISSDTSSLHFDPKIRFDVTTPTGHRKKTVFRKTPMPSKNTNVDDDQDGGGLIQRQTKVHFEPSKAYDQVTTPAKEHATKSFRKTPFPMAGKRAEVSNGVRFYASGDVSENSTPGKAKTVYRKTPCGKANISDDASSRSSSVKFSSELRFKTETPVRKPGQSYRQTPYLSARSKENEDSSFRGGDDRVRFDILDKSVSSVTLRSSKKQYRKTPHNKKIEAGLSEENENVEENYSSAEYDLYNRLKTQHSDSNTMRSPLADLSPPRATSSTPQHIRIMNREMVTTPMSMSSTLTGITGLTYTENNRELFPNTDSNAKKEKGAATGSRTSDASNPATTRAPAFATPRKSASGLIPRVTESELAQASPVVKMQASLDELNKAIYALNGAAFLKQSAANAQDQIIFSDTEAYKVLRNCGFKRRRCKGMLMSLCHFRRLRMRENDPDIYDHGGHFFEVVAPGQ